MQRSLIEEILVLALTEVGIVIVAAVAVATMNYIFFTQRRKEFGILYAVGRSRRWLVKRTMRETGSMVALAWSLSALVYVIGSLCVQTIVFAPKGLSLDITNPIPWLFTLPIPAVVVAASTGTIARLLSRLDPVTIIEGNA
jgi:ABC-type antimicrobial peptide transport system permease subunit